MSWTKRQYITEALEELGLASYVFDMQPEELQSGLRKLDALIAQWNTKGLRLRYPIPSTVAESDLDTDTGIPDLATEAVVCNLALRIAPSYGKTPSPQLMLAAKWALNSVMAVYAQPIDIDTIRSQAFIGAGDKPWRGVEPITEINNPISTGNDGFLEP